MRWITPSCASRKPRPQDNLTYENWLRGEVRDHGFTHGTGLGCEFGRDAGDTAKWRLPAAGRAVLRYRLGNNVRRADFGAVVLTDEPPADEFGFRTAILAVSPELRLTSTGGSAVELDGFEVIAAGQESQVRFEEVVWQHAPVESPGPVPDSLLLKHPDCPTTYGLRWRFDRSQVRRWHTNEIHCSPTVFLDLRF